MDTAKLKSYAPKARKTFIQAVTARAAEYGISEGGIAPMQQQGELVVIGGEAWPRRVAEQRNKLEARIQRQGFGQTMETIAYTWFNRLVAIRYMELHGYLDHGYRVLSGGGEEVGARGEGLGGQPEILDHATEVDLPGLDRERVIDLKLDGTKDEELYRLLLKAQCNALHRAMPFLFEQIDDETELLLPANLLHTDSLIRQLVASIDEELWQEIEIIGWLYQFYISEKKDQVIGKVVQSEDIPAATQLFTPNWIVKYMVQNSLGAQWLEVFPDSPLKASMEYYIEPAEQTEEVQAELARIRDEWLVEKGLGVRDEGVGDAETSALTPGPYILSPEDLTLIDPACGSGHILVEAYELFKAIYLERGYRLRDLPKLILEKNLYGLDIDERAAQLTGFALMMKGRADDRRLLGKGLGVRGEGPGVRLNVMALVDSGGLGVRGEGVGVSDEWLVGQGFDEPQAIREAVDQLVALFEHATTFGSLIQVPEELAEQLPELRRLSEAPADDLFMKEALERLRPLVRQAEILAARYDAVVANPPYMGGGGMNALVKGFAKALFPDARGDLFACFIERAYTLAKTAGRNAMVTMQTWMFLSSFQKMRERLLREKTITTMAQIGYNSFPSMNSKVAQAAVFSFANQRVANFSSTFVDLNSAPQAADKGALFLERIPGNRFEIAADEFGKIPGSPLAYWASKRVRLVFSSAPPLSASCKALTGMRTGDNERFLREWHEVAFTRLGIRLKRDTASSSNFKWFPYNKGGGFQKWFGNNGLVVNWADDGAEVKILTRERYPDLGENLSWKITNEDYYFRDGITWGGLTSLSVTFRYSNVGALFDSNKGAMMFPDAEEIYLVVGMLSSSVASSLLKVLNPSLSTQNRDIDNIPYWKSALRPIRPSIDDAVRGCIELAIRDDRGRERSWDFQSNPLVGARKQGLGVRGQETVDSDGEPSPLTPNPSSLESSYTAWTTHNIQTIKEMKRLEEQNNRLFIDAYGLQDELTPEVPIEQITLTVNPAYRYGWKEGARGEGLGVREEGARGEGLGVREEGARGEGLGIREEGEAAAPSPSPLNPKPLSEAPDPYSIPELEKRFREDTMKELVSYAIGCMMGRYRLDRPGLIYAHSGNERFWEIYEGGARDEGRGVSEKLPGSGGLAEVDGAGGKNISNDEGISAGREIRANESGPKGSGIHTIEHSGRSRSAIDKGVPELSVHRTGLDSGSGNTNLDRSQAGLRQTSTGPGNSGTVGGDQQDASRPQGKTSPSPLTPHPFPPDEDGIIPITDTEWFDDDACTRIVEFINVAFPDPSSLTPNPSLEENLTFLANNLAPKKNEASRDTLRRYLCDKFFKDHLQTYKKRPIYWLFSSGKQKAFQCLVYLHRYNEGTLSRMRMEYVTPLQGRLAARIETLDGDIQAAGTTGERNRKQKEKDKLLKQQDELRHFDEKLRHYADQRIALDLDDGVKVNYGKFGDLLAEVKAVTGKKGG